MFGERRVAEVVVRAAGSEDERVVLDRVAEMRRDRSLVQVDAGRFVTHHFTLSQFEEAYDIFARAGDTGALKVVLTRS